MVNRKRKIKMVRSCEKNEPGKVSCKISGVEATSEETSRTPKKAVEGRSQQSLKKERKIHRDEWRKLHKIASWQTIVYQADGPIGPTYIYALCM